MAAIQNEVV